MGAARELVERGIDLFNSGDVDQLVATYTADAVETLPGGEYTGRDAIGERLRDQGTAFPDRHLKPLSWVEEGDTVVVEYGFTGTHTGPLRLPDGTLLPPTGQRIAFSMVSIFQLHEGQAAVHRGYADLLPAMVQLGVVAPTGAA